MTVGGLSGATTRFGQFALECDDIAATVQGALDVSARMLGASAAALFRTVGSDRIHVVDFRGGLESGPEGDDGVLAAGEEFTLGSGVLSADDWVNEPLVISDWESGRCPVPSLKARLPTMLSTLAVGLPRQSRPYALWVADTTARIFRAEEVDAVTAVVGMLSAAMDRHQRETTQAAVAAFGEFALESGSVQTTVRRAVDLATEVLDTAIGFLVRVERAEKMEVLCGLGPLGEPFGGVVDAPGSMGEGWYTVRPLVSDRSLPWIGRRAMGHADIEVASLSVGFRVAGDLYRLGVMDTETRQFVDSDVGFLSSIAHLLASALKRDRVEVQLRTTSDALQRALLPAMLPVLDGIESTARYVSCGRNQVGGDWYDVLDLRGGAIGLVMGDVEGHDTVAASVMGQIRNVLRAYVAEGHPPAEVMSILNRFTVAQTDILITCCYVELRPGDLTVTCVTAGHPAPLVVQPDGTCWSLPVRLSPLLGVDADVSYQEQTTILPESCRLLLVTDGLVDDTGRALHVSDEAFRRAAASLAAAPLGQLADALVDRPPGAPSPSDDAALLAVGVNPSNPTTHRVERVFGPFTSAIPAARRYVADVLTQWELTDVLDSAVLATSEVVTNAVMHTTSWVLITLERLPSGVRIDVRDTNDRLPSRPDFPGTMNPDTLEPGGRGLGIVDQVARRWGIIPTPATGGKVVWLEVLSPAG